MILERNEPISKIFFVSQLHLLLGCQDIAVLLVLANLGSVKIRQRNSRFIRGLY